MKITIEQLKKWDACSDGQEYFAGKFPDGADYANVIAACTEDDEESYHTWLFRRVFEHVEVKELVAVEKAQIPVYEKKGLEPLALLDQKELKDTDTVSKEREAQLAASGDSSQLAASGDNSRLAASGYCSQLAASGENSIIASSGLDSKFSLGTGGCAAIPYRDENKKVRFAVAYVGENIKADTWYQVNAKGEFVEVEV